MKLRVQQLGLSGVLLFCGSRLIDERGDFEEIWNRRTLEIVGVNTDFVQDNQSRSTRPNTLRGMHFQAAPHAQAKLVRCVSGAIYDVVVDIRQCSPTYGQSLGHILHADTSEQLFVPEGFLHGFLTLAPNTVVQYKCSAFYEPSSEGVVRWDSIGVDWPLTAEPVLSTRDAEAISFDQFVSPFSK